MVGRNQWVFLTFRDLLVILAMLAQNILFGLKVGETIDVNNYFLHSPTAIALAIMIIHFVVVSAIRFSLPRENWKEFYANAPLFQRSVFSYAIATSVSR